MNGFVKCLFGVSMLALLAGCGKPVKPSDLPGTYVADYKFATDTLIIKADGQFIQSVKIKATDKVLTRNGKWDFKQANRDIVFDTNMMVIDNGYGEMNTNFDSQASTGISTMPVRKWFGRLQIGVDPGIPYKQQANPSGK